MFAIDVNCYNMYNSSAVIALDFSFEKHSSGGFQNLTNFWQ